MPIKWVTLVKVYKLVNLLIKDKEKKKQTFLDPSMTWNHGHELSQQLAKGLAEATENDLEWLRVIRKQLPPLPKCRHPKHLHDKCDGKWYCMGCNQDL